eukprot:TRINITY_DN15672_c0_g1_i1.p1 TRINITY_DN15672_c0_g1~~TRINITY_DN15672_c0_g1_i1.p1  ORF type:complete len:926 (+),score=284.18 TRINITY_DN15672_c0_g1_i1:218-2995(+)
MMAQAPRTKRYIISVPLCVVLFALVAVQAIVVDDATFSFTENGVAVHSKSSLWEKRSTGGPFATISANLHDQVYALNKAGQVMKFDDKLKKWSRYEPTVSTRYTEVKVGCDGTLWALDTKGQLFKKKTGRQTGDWTLETTVAVKSFSAGRGYQVWGVDKDGYAVQYMAGDKTWHRHEAKLKQISVGCSGTDPEIWGVSTDNKLWQMLRSSNRWRERANGVTSVTAGAHVYVTDSRYKVYRYNPAPIGQAGGPGHWKDMGFVASSISTGYDGCLWALNSRGEAFWHKGDNTDAMLSATARASRALDAGGSWEYVPGADGIESIAVGQKGELYGVTSTGAVKRFNQDNPKKWEDIPSSGLTDISCGCDGESVWGLTRSSGGKAARYLGLGKWEVYGEQLKVVTLGDDERTVYGVRQGNEGYLSTWSKDTKKWSYARAQTRREGADVLTDLTLQNVDAGCDGSLWAVDSSGELFAKDTRTADSVFSSRGTDVKSVSTGKYTYILDRRNFLFRYNQAPKGEVEGKIHWTMMHKQLRQVAASIDGNIYGVDLFGKVVQFKPIPDALKNKYQWKQIESEEPLSHIAVGSTRHIYTLDKYGAVLKRTDANTWAAIPGMALQNISVGCDGAIWGVKSNGDVVHQESLELGWTTLATPSGGPNIITVSVGRKGIVYGLDPAGEVYRYDYGKVQWTPVKEEPKKLNFKSLAVGCSGELWGVTGAGVVYMSRARANGAKWVLMGTGAQEIAIGSHVYMISKNHRLARWEPEKRRRFNKWVWLGTMAHVDASVDGAVWGLDAEGDAWVIQPGKPHDMNPPKPVITTAPTATPEIDNEPDNWSLSPYKAGTTDRHGDSLEELNKMDDKDDVSTMIMHWQNHLKNREALPFYKKKVNNPYTFEEDDVGNSVFKDVSKKIIKQRAETFPGTGKDIETPPF